MLRRIGYYRLSAYWYGFRQDGHGVSKLDDFQPAYSFNHAVSIYVFDKRLRMLLLDALERIEIAIRAEVAYVLGKQSPFVHTDPGIFREHFLTGVNPKTQLTWHQNWLADLDKLINRSGETFVEHNKRKYGLPLPIWISVEVWDFGLASKFVEGLTDENRGWIADAFDVSSGKLFVSWLRSLTYLRNICAHHARLWNKNMVDRPKLPAPSTLSALDHIRGNTIATSRVYGLLCIVIYLMSAMNPQSSWKHRLRQHVLSFPDVPGFGVGDMGFPEDWQEQSLWSPN